MGIIIKQSFWNSIWSLLGIALGYINLVLLYPIFLDTDEFGLTRIFIAAGVVTGQLGSLGVVNISLKYFPYFKSESDNKHNGFLFFGFLISSIGSVICLLALLFFKPYIVDLYIERSALFVEYFYWLIPLSISLIYFYLIGAYSRAILNSALEVFARDFLLRIFHLMSLGLYAFELIDFDKFIASFILSYFATGLFTLAFLVFKKTISFNVNWQFYKKLPLKEIATFGAFIMFSNLGSFVAGNIDILMLGSLSTNGLEDIAIYSVAYYMGNILSVPVKAVYGIAMPIIADAWKQNDFDKIQDIYTKSSLNQLGIGCLLFIGLWANIDSLFTFLPESYLNGKMVVFIIAGTQLFNIASGVNGGIILNAPYYRYDTFLLLLMIIGNIILNIILIKALGFVGAAYSTAITIGFFIIGRLIIVQVKSNMQPFSLKTVYLIIISLLVYGLQTLLPKIEIVLLDIAVRSILIVALYVPTLYFFNISEEINKILRKTAQSLADVFKK